MRRSIRTWRTAAALLATALLGVGCQRGQTDDQTPGAGAPTTVAPRAFRMGCTLFPSDMTLQALADVELFAKQNADVVSAHFEGVPWKEALSGEPFHPSLIGEWDRCLHALGPKSVIYLAASPLDMGRANMAPGRGEKEGLPIPPELAGKALDDPLVVRAYLAYCRRAIAHFKPAYVAIGIEANELYHNNHPKWDEYVRLHKAVYTALKREHPDLPIFATCTLHNLVNPSWNDRAGMLQAWQNLMPYNDMVALSYYPFLSQPGKTVRESLEWVAREFDRFGKPYTMTEMGQIAEPLELSAPRVVLPGTPQMQAETLTQTLQFANAHRFAFLIWFVARDYDGLWEKLKSTAPEILRIWRDCGLEDGAGRPRPACDVWRAAFARPLTPAAKQ